MEIGQLVSELHEIKQKKIELQKEIDLLNDQQNELEKVIKSKMDVLEEFADMSEDEFQMAMSDLVSTNIINVEVVYALRDRQTIKEIQVSRGATIDDCIATSAILQEYPEVDLQKNRVGIHGMIKPLTELVQEGDRVEIYRPVTAKS